MVDFFVMVSLGVTASQILRAVAEFKPRPWGVREWVWSGTIQFLAWTAFSYGRWR